MTNQEGKHTPEQKILIPEQKRKEWREAITMIFAGVGHPDSIHFYTMGRSDEFASQSSELSKLREFKAYVHKRLDDAGVEVDPDSPHKEAGCRIGGRLDIVLGEMSESQWENSYINEKAYSDRLQYSLTEREAEVERLKLALNMIMQLEPETHDEWGEAACFTQAQDIANVALGLTKAKPTE